MKRKQKKIKNFILVTLFTLCIIYNIYCIIVGYPELSNILKYAFVGAVLYECLFIFVNFDLLFSK